MKLIRLSCAILMFLSIITSGCKKTLNPFNINNNNSNGGGRDTSTAQSTSVGFPNGPLVSKYIPAGGGSITTSDGRIEIDFPNGALSAGDTITIMNITNNTLGGIGDAYRFLPDGLKFSNPVTIKYHYLPGDLAGTAPQFLGIAFQDSSGIWNEIVNGTNDTSSSTLSVRTSHFTDYGAFAKLKITPTIPVNVKGSLSTGFYTLKVSQGQGFQVGYVTGGQVSTNPTAPASNDDDLLAPLIHYVNVPMDNIDRWTLNGDLAAAADPLNGIAMPNGSLCQYTAPASPPEDNPVQLSVQLKGLKYYDPKLHTTFSTLIVSVPVKIVNSSFIFDVGVYYHSNQVDGGQGLAFTVDDSAHMLVTVTNLQTITVSNFVNAPETVTPGSQSFNTCSSTWVPDKYGPMNIVGIKDSYFITSSFDNSTYVELTLLQTNTTVPQFTVVCSTSSGSAGGVTDPGVPGGFGFIVQEGTQSLTEEDVGVPGVTVKVVSK